MPVRVVKCENKRSLVIVFVYNESCPRVQPLAAEGSGPIAKFDMSIDTFNDKQSQIAERKTGDGRGPGDCSKEAA